MLWMTRSQNTSICLLLHFTHQSVKTEKIKMPAIFAGYFFVLVIKLVSSCWAAAVSQYHSIDLTQPHQVFCQF